MFGEIKQGNGLNNNTLVRYGSPSIFITLSFYYNENKSEEDKTRKKILNLKKTTRELK